MTTAGSATSSSNNIKEALGLPTPSLIAFLLGIGCFLAAISLGMIYTVKNFADFQALQLWRLQWLLGQWRRLSRACSLKERASKATRE